MRMGFRYAFTAAALFSSGVLFPSLACAQTGPTIKLNAGLEAQIASLGRVKTGNYVTVALTIVNKGSSTIHMMLVGSPPAAVDNTGTQYTYNNSSGISRCSNWNVIDQCIGVPNVTGLTLSLQAYTQLDPGSQLTANFELFGHESDGPLASFAATIAYRLVGDPLRDDTLTEAQKRKQIRVMNLSFPPSPLTPAK
jgi:hypothetical protein